MKFTIEIDDDKISVSFPRRGLYHCDVETVNAISLSGALNRMAEIAEGEREMNEELNFFRSLSNQGDIGRLALKIMASMFISDSSRYAGRIEPKVLELYGRAMRDSDVED